MLIIFEIYIICCRTLNEDLLNDTLKPSPEHSQYASLYKALTKNRETSQSERREQFLKEIRK